MNKPFRFAAVLGIMASFAGCASIDGAPKPVIDVRQAVDIPTEYRVKAITRTVGEDQDMVNAKRTRNRAIAIYMSAMDARYAEFRRALSNESKGWNTGLDLGVLAFSSLGAVAKKSGNELAAAAAFLSGARGTINKELYFDRTLPALLSAMEANRTRVRTTLVERMRQGIADYPMELAFLDLSAYEVSASLDGAIQQVTVDAAKSLAAEDEKYKDAVASCVPKADLMAGRARLNRYVYGLAGGKLKVLDDAKLVKLAQVAVALDVTPSKKAADLAEAEVQADAIIDAAAAACSKEGLDALFVKFKSATGEDVPS